VRVASAQDGVFRHITVVDTDGNVLIDMSGEVVANPSLEIARTFDVEVKNPDFHSFGTLTWPKFLPAMLLAFLVHVTGFAVSIYFERRATAGTIPFWRNLIVVLVWSICNGSCCVDQWTCAMAGVKATGREYLVGNVCVVIFTMGCSFLPLSRNSLSYGCCGVLFASMTFFAYMMTEQGPDWRLKDSLLWSVAQLSGTVGTALVMTTVGVMYAFLLMQGQNVVATFFLPLGTALAELGTIIYMRKVYNKLVWSKRSDGIQRVRGDQISICAPVVIICAHGFAEATRFSATFCGAVLSGGYTGIFTTALGMLLNLSARLGWSRYVLIQTTKKYCGGPTAMAYWAPSAWSKYHDEVKRFIGYARFLVGAAAIVGRWVNYGDFGFATFNLQAGLVFVVALVLEFLEDKIVEGELLPVNAVGPGLLKVNAAGTNADPCQLLAVEYSPSKSDDPWRMHELRKSGRCSQSVSIYAIASKRSTKSTKTIAPKSDTEEVEDVNLEIENTKSEEIEEVDLKLSKRVALGPADDYVWARFRRWLGQPRSLTPSLPLHGLRPLPFMYHFSIVGIILEVTRSLVELLIGGGYLRGVCPAPEPAELRLFGYFVSEVPMRCQ